MKNIVKLLLVASLTLFSCQGGKNTAADYNIIPLPNDLIIQSGSFILQGEVPVFISSDSVSKTVFDYLGSSLKNTTIILKQVSEVNEASVSFVIDDSFSDEAYSLNVSSDKIEIKGNKNGAGLFYGVQSLLQLMPAEIYNSEQEKLAKIEIPAVAINDSPRFSYRGAMMDVGRNFMPKEFVLKFIDMIAMYKMNRFHFHLTDDQGWRIEIKKYPKLTEIGSYRKQTQVGHCDYYWPRRYDGKEKRGFYTQEEIKEIVKYASERFITVVPEIEMPGHASAALASYPELSCGLGKTYVVRDYFDVFDEVFCPKEHTFAFLEDVLTEVIDLFPSHYIHIGGDECPKKAWKKCTHCQALMKKKGLKDEEALQSMFIHRIEKFVNSKGRDIIGWDEILEGGLAPNATVMSWRGEKGGIAAAKQHNKVIMTPGRYCYLDYYQENPEYASVAAIGGFLPLDSVYAYNPLPAELTEEEQSYVIGVQGNVWGEYIQTPEHFEYVAFPRLLAMAEVQWTKLDKKDLNQFTHRLVDGFKRLDYCGVNACRNFYEVNLTGTWNKADNAYEVTLKSFYPDADIYYSINDSTVTPSSNVYKGAFRLKEDAMIYAAVYKDSKPLGKVTRQGFAVNKATGRSYEPTPKAGWEHLNEGFGLADGIRGYSHSMRRWISFYKDTVQIVFNLEQPQLVKEVTFSSLWKPCNEIWPARGVSISVSKDGKTFMQVGSKELTYDFTLTEGTRFPVSLSFPETEATFVRLELLSGGLCLKGYYNEGKQSELAMDEIEIH